MTKKKVKVRVKKRKLKIGRILICLLVLFLIGVFFYFVRKLPIKNIYIIGNNIVPESDILDLSGIKNYPSFIDTSSSKIIKNIKTNEYIKDVKVEKKIWGKIYIYIEEEKNINYIKMKLNIINSGKII